MNVPPTNCCDTGGCIDKNNKFALNCSSIGSGKPPVTVAEFTLAGPATNVSDFYDISMVDGGNVPVSIVPDPNTYNMKLNDGITMMDCKVNSDCNVMFGLTSKCDTTLTPPKCVRPFRCGSPGCVNEGECAAQGIDRSLIPSCKWDPSSNFAIPETACQPSQLRVTKQQNQETGYVGCIAPQKLCRKECKTFEQCPAPFPCMNGFCSNNGGILGVDCDSLIMDGTTTSKGDLWGCTGPNSGSCFSEQKCKADIDCAPKVGGLPIIKDKLPTCTSDADCKDISLSTFFSSKGLFTCNTAISPKRCVFQLFMCDTTKGLCVDSNCCGCPSWVDQSTCTAGNNPTWVEFADPIGKIFNDACGTAYSFAFDDKFKTFTCASGGLGPTNVRYTVTFCP